MKVASSRVTMVGRTVSFLINTVAVMSGNTIVIATPMVVSTVPCGGGNRSIGLSPYLGSGSCVGLS